MPYTGSFADRKNIRVVADDHEFKYFDEVAEVLYESEMQALEQVGIIDAVSERCGPPSYGNPQDIIDRERRLKELELRRHEHSSLNTSSGCNTPEPYEPAQQGEQPYTALAPQDFTMHKCEADCSSPVLLTAQALIDLQANLRSPRKLPRTILYSKFQMEPLVTQTPHAHGGVALLTPGALGDPPSAQATPLTL